MNETNQMAYRSQVIHTGQMDSRNQVKLTGEMTRTLQWTIPILTIQGQGESAHAKGSVGESSIV